MLIRILEEPDLPFLREMLYAALFWRPEGDRPPFEWALAHPAVAMYHEDWGRPGDFGLIAQDGDKRIGAIWCRLFTEKLHGDGFVDEETPEMAIAVVDGRRGLGIGSSLLGAFAEQAKGAGIRQMSLSVDADNPAKRLYRKVGYVEFSPDDDKDRMLLSL